MNTPKPNNDRLNNIAAYDIQTHHAPHMKQYPWLAIPMAAARHKLAGHGLTEEESGDIAEMMAGYCSLLEEAGLTFLGPTKREVEDAAIAWCRKFHNQ